MAINNYYHFEDRIYESKYYEAEPWQYAEERFRKKYTLHVEKSKRHYRQRPIPISYTAWLKQGADIPFHQDIEREPLLKVYISEEHYETLVKREQYLDNLERENKVLCKLQEAQIAEEHIRLKNPTVQKAWEKYKMLLELVK